MSKESNCSRSDERKYLTSLGPPTVRAEPGPLPSPFGLSKDQNYNLNSAGKYLAIKSS